MLRGGRTAAGRPTVHLLCSSPGVKGVLRILISLLDQVLTSAVQYQPSNFDRKEVYEL